MPTTRNEEYRFTDITPILQLLPQVCLSAYPRPRQSRDAFTNPDKQLSAFEVLAPAFYAGSSVGHDLSMVLAILPGLFGSSKFYMTGRSIASHQQNDKETQ